MNYDAIVIGAGPAGSSAALALAEQGWTVAIIERSVFPRRKVCGEFISATNLALLDRFGVGKIWRTEAGPEVRRVGLFVADSMTDAPMPRIGAKGYGRALGRDLLDALLLAAAQNAGADVFQPWHAVAIGTEGEFKTVLIVSGVQEKLLRAPVVIAAHGSWEPEKLPSGLPRINGPSDLFGFKAHFTNAQLPKDLMPLFVFPGGYGGAVWSDGGRLSISCCIRRDALAAVRAGGQSAGDAVFKHIMATNRGVKTKLAGAGLESSWLAAGPIRPGIRPCYADDIFRAGNLAGEAHPIVAEGISMAVQSGWLLASELARTDLHNKAARESAGRRYAALWRQQFFVRIHAAAALAAILARPRLATTAASLVGGFPILLTLGARLSGKTRRVPGFGNS